MSQWAEDAIEEACRKAQNWYRSLRPFENQVNLGTCVGRKFPEILSEQDCVMNFARFLNEAEVSWDAIHHQVWVSRWLFDKPHPAASAGLSKKWCVDLALLKSEDFLAAVLPAKERGFQFDACLEFAYLSNSHTLPGADRYGNPQKGRQKVFADVEKIGRYLGCGFCRLGYVIVFEECDWEFETGFVPQAEQNHGCRVRFVRGYPQ